MKSLDDLKEAAADKYVSYGYGCDGDTSGESFRKGFDCGVRAAQNLSQDKIQQLEAQNKIMGDALERISQETILLGTERSTGAILARQALKDAEEV